MPYKVENIVRTGEIACYKQFLLSHHVFHCYISLVHQNAALCKNGLSLHSLPDNRILDRFKLEALANELETLEHLYRSTGLIFL